MCERARGSAAADPPPARRVVLRNQGGRLPAALPPRRAPGDRGRPRAAHTRDRWHPCFAALNLNEPKRERRFLRSFKRIVKEKKKISGSIFGNADSVLTVASAWDSFTTP